MFKGDRDDEADSESKMFKPSRRNREGDGALAESKDSATGGRGGRAGRRLREEEEEETRVGKGGGTAGDAGKPGSRRGGGAGTRRT